MTFFHILRRTVVRLKNGAALATAIRKLLGFPFVAAGFLLLPHSCSATAFPELSIAAAAPLRSVGFPETRRSTRSGLGGAPANLWLWILLWGVAWNVFEFI